MIGPVKVLTIGVARSCVLQTPLPPPNVLRSVAVLHMHQNICKVDSCARIRLTASGRQHLQNVEKHTSTRRKDSYTYGMQNGKIGMCQNIEQTCNHSGS